MKIEYGKREYRMLWQGRQWAVTTFGIERRDGGYTIAANRLREGLGIGWSWIGQIGEKDWADIKDFASCFYVAVAMHGYQFTADEMVMLQKHYERGKSLAPRVGLPRARRSRPEAA